MKPEPLKGKKRHDAIPDTKYNPCWDYFAYRDIKSAVDWLKKHIAKRIPFSSGFYIGDMEDIILKTIDEAFEDVINPPKPRGRR